MIPILKEFFVKQFRLGSETGPLVLSGTGSPEGIVTAPVGSTYHREDGSVFTTVYHKESGSGNTGWSPVRTYASQDPRNMVQDFSLADDGYWTVVGGTFSTDSVALATATLNANRVMKSSTGNGTTSQTSDTWISSSSKRIRVTAGQQYHVSMKVYVLSGFTGMVGPAVNWFKADGTASSTPITGINTLNYTTVAAPADLVVDSAGSLTAPADAAYAEFVTRVVWSTVINNAGLAYIAWPRMTSISTVELLSLSDPDNFLLDSSLEAEGYWIFTGADFSKEATATIDTALNSSTVITFGTGNGTTSQPQTSVSNINRKFSVDSSLTYRLSVETFAKDGFTGRFRLDVFWFKGDGTAASSASTFVSNGADYRTSANGADVLETLSGDVVPPSDAKLAYVRLLVQWSTVINNAQNIYAAWPKFYKLPASSGSTNGTIVNVNFGSSFSQKASVVVTGQTWVSSGNPLTATVLTPTGSDPDELFMLDLKPVISSIVTGTGFTLTLYTEAEAKGIYPVMIVGK